MEKRRNTTACDFEVRKRMDSPKIPIAFPYHADLKAHVTTTIMANL
jgi:hypothetical protein